MKKKVIARLKNEKKEHKKKHHSKKKVAKKVHHKKKHSAKETPKFKSKVEKVMHEFKSGALHSGSKKGPKVTNPKQAIAISLSEARKAKKK